MWVEQEGTCKRINTPRLVYLKDSLWNVNIKLPILIGNTSNKFVGISRGCPIRGFVRAFQPAVPDSNPKQTFCAFKVKFCPILSLYLEKDENKPEAASLGPYLKNLTRIGIPKCRIMDWINLCSYYSSNCVFTTLKPLFKFIKREVYLL